MKIDQVASRYRIIRELGRGGMGVVYVVEHVHTGEHLALKLLHGAAASNPAAIARFKREARVGAQIKSEHVVRVTDADIAPELEGAPFFVMELLEGLDLEKAVAKLGRFEPALVIELLGQIARALDKAHAIGIIHRDLKPENIFLHRREDGSVIAKVLDFGISKFLYSMDSTGLGVTAEGTIMGTPFYMAPEQARGAVESMSPATDMWAIGLIAIRLLTAEAYWTARTHVELMVQILVTPMSRPSARWPWLGEGFDGWFARSCNRDPGQRWGSVSEQVASLAEAFRSASSGSGASMQSLVQALASAAIRTASPPLRNAPSADWPPVPHDLPALPAAAPANASSDPWMRPPSLGASTNGPKSVTLSPGVQRSRARSWGTVGIIGLAALASAVVVVYRTSLMERMGLSRQTEGSHGATSPDGVATIAAPIPPQKPATLGAPSTAREVDAGRDGISGATPIGISSSSAESMPAPSPAVSPSAPGRRAPRIAKPRPTRLDDPMAP